MDVKSKANFLLVSNSINFCYWGDPKWAVQYKNMQYDGYLGMIACIKKAIDNGIPILEADYLAGMKKEELSEILKGNAEIPLFEERLKILREIGSMLVQKYDGSFYNAVKNAEKDALKLLDIIVTDFPSFNDSSIYDEKKAFFHKRAQLLVLDTYSEFKGKEMGDLRNIEQLTAAADYKIPQILRKLGIMEYSQALAEKVDHIILIPHDSREEIEIRASMVWAIELIKRHIEARLPDITAMDIDHYLWLHGQNKPPDDRPYHLTRTIFY